MLAAPIIRGTNRKRPVPPAPTLIPKRKREERRVFLEGHLWKALDEIAEFHGDAFDAVEADEKVSRNDVIAALLEWAVVAYWDARGGKPATDKEWDSKVARLADEIRRAYADESRRSNGHRSTDR